MAWTSPNDILARWVGANPPTDIDQIRALITDAEAVIRSEFPKIQDRLDANQLELDIVILVTSRMVIRVLRNPEGLTFTQFSSGPFSQGKNYGSTEQGIFLQPDEEELLRPTVPGKAFSIDLAPDATAFQRFISMNGNDYVAYPDRAWEPEDPSNLED
jgi:hypothetical protein